MRNSDQGQKTEITEVIYHGSEVIRANSKSFPIWLEAVEANNQMPGLDRIEMKLYRSEVDFDLTYGEFAAIILNLDSDDFETIRQIFEAGWFFDPTQTQYRDPSVIRYVRLERMLTKAFQIEQDRGKVIN